MTKTDSSSVLKLYYQLTKPGIVYSNVMAAAAGFLFAARWHISVALAVGVLVGTAFVIAAACVCNNYLDQRIDRKMERTKQRGIAAGKITGMTALPYAAILGMIGFASLAWLTNALTFTLGCVAFFFYVVVYGFAKRRSVHGTLVGTIPGALPPVAGYTAVTGHLDASAVIIFLIMVCWQMSHFYAIAIRRRDDYAAAGIPVRPVVKGIRNTKIHMLVYVTLFILACVALTIRGGTGYVFLVGMTGVGIYWLGRGIRGFRTTDDRKWAGSMFGLSFVVLLTFCGLLAVGSLLP
jgi:protoheme IX farnesyltransferase